MANFLIDYWYILLAFFAIGVVFGYKIYSFILLPNSKKKENVRKWLLGAVSEAEKKFGSKTGALKLASVYDAFVTKFPIIARILPFNDFSDMVDDALDEMRELLDTNDNIKEYVEGK